MESQQISATTVPPLVLPSFLLILSTRKIAHNLGVNFATPGELFNGTAPDPYTWDVPDPETLKKLVNGTEKF